MARRKIWEQRVAAWRQSGRSGAEFSVEHGLKERTLREWARRLHGEGEPPPTAPVRLARVVRSAATAPPTRVFSEAAAGEAGLVIEMSGARVTVGRGADLAMVVTVLSMLGTGGGR